MDSIQTLTELFKEFPGIGPRQARRFVYFLLSKDAAYNAKLASLISKLRENVSTCEMCRRFFRGNGVKTCPTCSDTKRDKTKMMIVARDIDFENIEKTKAFLGYYFVLGGTVPILEKNPGEKIHEHDLGLVVAKRINDGLLEIILATDYNPEGEHTREYIARSIKNSFPDNNIKISTLGRGLSLGTELEYSDGDTLRDALQSRR